MALQPQDRYATARALADDLELWMADEPVDAHRKEEKLVERAGRLMRRYRNWTFSIAAATLLIMFVAILASLLINRARVQEQVAKQQASQYRTEALGRYRQSREAVDTFLVEANESLNYYPATLGIRQHMLEMAEQHYAELSSEINQDPELELERGRALVRLGDVLQMQARFMDARPRYETAIETFENDAPEKTHPTQRLHSVSLSKPHMLVRDSHSAGILKTRSIRQTMRMHKRSHCSAKRCKILRFGKDTPILGTRARKSSGSRQSAWQTDRSCRGTPRVLEPL